jgi:phage tail-like protein
MTDYALPHFHFQVDWGGAKLAFSVVSGLKDETEAIEYRDGHSKVFSVVKMPGIKKHSDVTLKRGIFNGTNDGFHNWWKSIQLNKAERCDMTISLLDETSKLVKVWKIKGVWPLAIDSPVINSTGSEVAIESITIANEGIEIENDSKGVTSHGS